MINVLPKNYTFSQNNHEYLQMAHEFAKPNMQTEIRFVKQAHDQQICLQAACE